MNARELPPWPWYDGEALGEIIRRADDVRVGAWVLVGTQRRVYARDEQGRSVGGPLARYAYEPQKVHAETKFSWLIGPEWAATQLDRADKHPKRLKDGQRRAFYGLDDVEDTLWLGSHAYKLARHIEQMKDIDLLRHVAAITGYDRDAEWDAPAKASGIKVVEVGE